MRSEACGVLGWVILAVVFLVHGEMTNCLICVVAAQQWLVMLPKADETQEEKSERRP